VRERVKLNVVLGEGEGELKGSLSFLVEDEYD